MSLEQQRNSLSRRSFIKGATGIGGGLACASCAGAFGLSEVEATHDRRDAER